jgi:OCT family organic cation transporter-like MFS transporter 18
LVTSILVVGLHFLKYGLLNDKHAGQMIVTDTSSGSERAGALGLLGISYGVGMVIGPFIGGLVTKFFR